MDSTETAGAAPFDAAEFAARHAALTDILDMQGLDALVLTAPASLAHLAGLDGLAGGLIVTRDEVVAVVPEAQAGRAGRAGPCRVLAQDARLPDGFWQAAAAMLGKGLAVGVEAGAMTMVAAEMLAHHLGPRRGVDVAPAVRACRALRSPAEIALLRQLAGAADRGLAAIVAAAGDGAREIDLARMGEAAMTAGLAMLFPGQATTVRAFVTSGAGTDGDRVPPGPRRIGPGDLLGMVCVAAMAGSAASVGRTRIPGGGTGPQADGLAALAAARQAGLAAIVPGATAAGVEAAIDACLAADGQARARVAAPALMLGGGPGPEPLGDLALEPGMVVILSPFLRLPKGGLRSEEMVLVTETGAEPLAAPAEAAPEPDAG